MTRKQQIVDNGNETVITFGKNKGLTLLEVWKNNPGYIEWLVSVENNYEFGKMVRSYAEIIKNTNFWKKKIYNEKEELLKVERQIQRVNEGDIIDVTFEKNLKIDEEGAYYNHQLNDNLTVTLRFKHYKTYNYGGFAYALPIIKKGKNKGGRRIKHDTYKIRINPINTGTTEQKKVWCDTERKYVKRVVLNQPVAVTGMKLVS